MPIRWYICPVDDAQEATPEPGPSSRLVRVGALGFAFSGAVGVADWAVCFVPTASDAAFAPIAADPQCIDLLGQSYEEQAEILSKTPAQLEWANNRVNQLRNRLEQRGVNTAGLTSQTPLEDWLTRLMQAVHPSFKARGTRVG